MDRKTRYEGSERLKLRAKDCLGHAGNDKRIKTIVNITFVMQLMIKQKLRKSVGIEPATKRGKVQITNHYATEPMGERRN